MHSARDTSRAARLRSSPQPCSLSWPDGEPPRTGVPEPTARIATLVPDPVALMDNEHPDAATQTYAFGQVVGAYLDDDAVPNADGRYRGGGRSIGYVVGTTSATTSDSTSPARALPRP